MPLSRLRGCLLWWFQIHHLTLLPKVCTLSTYHGLVVSGAELALSHELAEGVLLDVGATVETANVRLDDATHGAPDLRLERVAAADSPEVLRIELADSRSQTTSEVLARAIRSGDRI